jgi:beta-phosphoglucomutase-like phosphatase (HAD superfamily)
VATPQVERGKPYPDSFREAARRLGVLPEQCLVVEDAPSGMEVRCGTGKEVVLIREEITNQMCLAGAHAGTRDSVVYCSSRRASDCEHSRWCSWAPMHIRTNACHAQGGVGCSFVV